MKEDVDKEINEFYSHLASDLQALEGMNQIRQLPCTLSKGCEVWKDGVSYLNLSSNDYIGIISNHLNAFSHLPPGSSSSRLLTGDFPALHELEKHLAKAFKKEDCLVYNTGYHMNTGIIPAIANNKMLCLADRLVHASIIDGIRLSGTHFERFRHNDFEHLETLLKKHIGQYPYILIIVESIYSMDGDEADLLYLKSLKRKYPNVLLYVDEAHAFGVRGEKGLGLAEEMGVIPDIDFLCGTFGKAIGSLGGFVVCKEVVKQVLVNKSRPLIFSTALPPQTVEQTLSVIKRLSDFQEERKHLKLISDFLREELHKDGWVMPSSSHIIPLLIGRNEACIQFSQRLREQGFYALPIRYPSVPKGSARIRISLTAALSFAQIEKLLAAIRIAKQALLDQ